MCWTSKRQHGGTEGPGRITFRVRFFLSTSFNELTGNKNYYSLKRTYTEISFLKQTKLAYPAPCGYTHQQFPLLQPPVFWQNVSDGGEHGNLRVRFVGIRPWDHGMVLESTIQTLKDHRMVLINIWTAKKAANKQGLIKSIQILSRFQSVKAISK